VLNQSNDSVFRAWYLVKHRDKPVEISGDKGLELGTSHKPRWILIERNGEELDYDITELTCTAVSQPVTH
jgi:hypothetical protein